MICFSSKPIVNSSIGCSLLVSKGSIIENREPNTDKSLSSVITPDKICELLAPLSIILTI